MPNSSLRVGEAAPLSAVGVLDRREAVPKLISDPNDFLIIAALAGTAKDTAHLCEPNANYYACAGVMGGATAMGLGLALAQPTRRVLVMAGDGDLLMNVGTLATVAIMTGQWLLLPVIAVVPVAETITVILQIASAKFTRRYWGIDRRIFRQAPLHGHFELGGWSETQIVQRFWLVGLLSAMLGIALALV